MRARLLLAALAAATGLAACATGDGAGFRPASRDCTDLFVTYDRYERSTGGATRSLTTGTWRLPASLDRQTRLLIENGCITRSAELDGLATLASRHPDFRILEGGAAIRPVPVHLGVVSGIGDEMAVTRAFRGLGYRSRGIGAEKLGRRLYIGPFTSQVALDQALAIAREAGFRSPYPATQTRF